MHCPLNNLGIASAGFSAGQMPFLSHEHSLHGVLLLHLLPGVDGALRTSGIIVIRKSVHHVCYSRVLPAN